MRCHPAVLRQLKDGRWEKEEPAGSGNKSIYPTYDEASSSLSMNVGAVKISHCTAQMK